MAYSGSSKVEFCRRLGADWRKLADDLEIAASDQAGFAQGDEARRLWAWLEEHGQFSKLPVALRFIDRQDLLDTLQEQQQASFRDYFQDRISEWSKDRFALDKRFVQLTLLLDQGEETQGPRWAAQPPKFQDLRVALAALSDHPAVVLLGPPGSGKSTIPRAPIGRPLTSRKGRWSTCEPLRAMTLWPGLIKRAPASPSPSSLF